MEFVTVFVTGVIGKLAENTVEPVINQVRYVVHCKQNLRNLETQVDNLVAARERVQHTVDEVKRKGKRIEKEVENWLKRVDETTGEAKIFLQDGSQAKTKCLHGFCPCLIPQYQLSKKSTKLAQVVAELYGNRDFPSVSYTAVPQEIWSIRTKDYEAFGSRIPTVKKIMEKLRDSNSNMIGVYGIAGVGKTTLVKEVFRQAIEEKLFDDVVLILDVKKNPDGKNIQREIAEKLGLDVSEDQSIAARSRSVYDRITGKKVLVILDDVWEGIDLEAMGLPSTICKILLTSRSREVLYSEMHTDVDFALEVLDKEESWSLFEKMAGDVVKNSAIRTVAIQVAEKCGGLPVLVVTVASALKRGTLPTWKDALRRLKRFDKEELTKKAYMGLEWTYNQLEDNELKPLFLLCAMTAAVNSTFVEDLLKYSMGVGLVKNVNKVEEVRNALHSLIEKLKDSCLLLDDGDNKYVRMHDLVRDVAISIGLRDHHVLSRADGDELNEWPNKDFLEKCTAIALHCTNIPQLPEVLECRELKIFLLNFYREQEIPCNLFQEMKELKVLDLSNLHFQSLPSSIQFLTNLQTLCLHGCVLGDIALIGQLRSLKVLSLLHSHIEQLPEEIGQLTGLQLLDLTGCTELKVIPPTVISSLTRLEDLRMRNSFNQWDAERLLGQRSNASLSELKQLSQLTALDIHILDAIILPEDFFSSKLERYHIVIGDWSRELSSPRYETSTTLQLKLNTSCQLDHNLRAMLKRSEKLCLDGLEGVTDIVYQLDSEGFQQLKHLYVQNSAEVTSIINSTKWSHSHYAFPVLESLVILNLISLQSVCCGQLTAETFHKLRIFKVTSCDKLKNVFTSSTARFFLHLQEMEVNNCKAVKEIVAEEKKDNVDEEVIDTLEFSQLWSLTLKYLPELFGFVCIGSGPTRRKVLFPNLTSLEVHRCDGLRFLFSSSMARSLVLLERLQISRCEKLEEIVSTEEEEDDDEISDNMFCKLEHLQLDYLNNLSRFCSGRYVKFPSLVILTLRFCPKLGPFISAPVSKTVTICNEIEEKATQYPECSVQTFLFDRKVQFPSLDTLTVNGLNMIKTIWQKQTNLAPDSFCKLRAVYVYGCQSLISIFDLSSMENLNGLQILQLNSCDSLQVIFETEGVNVKETSHTSATQLKTFDIQNLQSVGIRSCRNLKCVFPLSVARSLPKLEVLKVEGCGMEEIVAKVEGPDTTPEFVFHKVTSMVFVDLPHLRAFYPAKHSSEWPLLKDFSVHNCPKFEKFAKEHSLQQTKQLADIEHIFLEAKHRWLHPAEICEILQNYKKYRLAPEAVYMPPSGSLFLFDRKVLRFFRRDGHNWSKKSDGWTVRESHKRLQVGSVNVMHRYTASAEENENFQRRSYWMLEEGISHIVLVHYLEIKG